MSTDEKLGVWELAPPDAPDFGALEAPPEALSEDLPDALLLSEDALLLSEDLPDALLPDEAPGALLPVDPPEALPEDLLSVADGAELVDPDAPLAPEELGLCASATPASRKSAAAVAVPTTLTAMSEFLLGELGRTAALSNAMNMPGECPD